MARQITNNQSIMLEGTTSFDGINLSPNKNGEEVKKIRWWKKLLDLKEARTQVLFSLPIILTNVCYYTITLISVMFAGHLGQLQLAGATLANSWATATGFGVMVGLSGSLKTLCGQSFGAKLYRMLGIYLQASCLISICFSTILAIAWFYTEPILILIHQDPHISATAALYIKCLIPGLFAYGFLQNILRFLQTQSVVYPLVLFSLIPLCIHIGISYSLVHFTPLGFKGAPVATSISLWILVIMLSSYVICTQKFKHTWTGFSMESFSYFLVNLKLALPSAGMICLEYWAFEILVLLAGLMPNSEVSTSLLAMCLSTQSVAYMLGVSAAASTRVSNELGAGEPGRAKNAMFVTLKLSVFVALLSVTALGFGHNAWAGLFSDNILIKKKFATLVPLLATSIAIDSVQNVVAGVMRGCGWQHLTVYINLAAFYLIGIPLSCLLGFKFKLYVRGLWGGLVSGHFCDAIILLFIVFRKKMGGCRSFYQYQKRTKLSSGLTDTKKKDESVLSFVFSSKEPMCMLHTTIDS